LINQIVIMNPIAVPLWGVALYYYFSRRGSRYRVFGWAYLLLFALFIVLQAKSYFLAPAYPPLFAGGAMVFGAWQTRWRRAVTPGRSRSQAMPMACRNHWRIALAERTGRENNAPVLILRQPKAPFEALWRQAKHYD
jgi:hypothetical protein